MEIEVGPDGRLVISYKDERVVAKGLKEFEVALRIAVNFSLNVLKDYPQALQNRDIDPIRRFWATFPN